MTYELANELKADGFPQPGPAFGQAWYLPSMGTVDGKCLPYIVNYATKGEVYFSGVGVPVQLKAHVGLMLSMNVFLAAATFAPSLEDTLTQLPPLCEIRRFHIPAYSDGVRRVEDDMHGFEVSNGEHHTSSLLSAAEAAAKMWLEINKKP